MSAELELQGAINTRLRDDAQLTALVNKRVYDLVPSSAEYPYIAIGETQSIQDDATCITGEKVYLTLHAWSDEVGFPEVKRIASAVKDSLHLAPIELPTYRLVSLLHRQTRTLRDRDGITSHAVIELLASVHKPLA
ncbi:MAG: DUF3168 domain-containing protein [Alphaproteobacteria bacterium]|nr:MAG: DUF3168 domain-containing protein [Alphaproteobacteria bacterium]